MWPLMARSPADVRWRRLLPICGRLLAVEGAILIPVEEIQERSRHASETREIGNGPLIGINPTQAAETGLHGADAGLATIEARSAAAQAAEQVEMANFSVVIHDSFSFPSMGKNSVTVPIKLMASNSTTPKLPQPYRPSKIMQGIINAMIIKHFTQSPSQGHRTSRRSAVRRISICAWVFLSRKYLIQ
ncbi:hypothetical protein GGI1_14868 [Acidithiobacillus sp. GGI-221]|nr:hypothetical protein GGI1_14868 [Acidithiobacillus sp. GGI-221]